MTTLGDFRRLGLFDGQQPGCAPCDSKGKSPGQHTRCRTQKKASHGWDYSTALDDCPPEGSPVEHLASFTHIGRRRETSVPSPSETHKEGRNTMCRWLAYSGTALPLEELLYTPVHSLIDQSLHSR